MHNGFFLADQSFSSPTPGAPGRLTSTAGCDHHVQSLSYPTPPPTEMTKGVASVRNVSVRTRHSARISHTILVWVSAKNGWTPVRGVPLARLPRPECSTSMALLLLAR